MRPATRARISIAKLLGVILLIALGIGALRSATWIETRLVFAVTLVILTTCLLGAILRGRSDGGGWWGASLFGWGAFLVLFELSGTSSISEQLGTATLSRAAFEAINGPPVRTDWIIPPPSDPEFAKLILLKKEEDTRLNEYVQRSGQFQVIGHSLLALVMAAFGAILGMVLGRDRRRPASPGER